MIETMPAVDIVEEPRDQARCRAAGNASALRLAELLLKDRVHVDDLLRDEDRQAELIPRFLAIALSSFSVYACAMVLLLFAAPADSLPSVLAPNWSLAA